jgi:hypothetical protein
LGCAEKNCWGLQNGIGKEVMKKYGIKFYTSSLFEFEQDIHPFFKK